MGKKLFPLRQMMQTVYGVETMFQGAYSTGFQANEKGKVFLLDIAGKWVIDLEDDNRENFLNRKSSNIVLQAENDVAVWFQDQRRIHNNYDTKELSGERLSLLAKVIIEEVVMTRYERLTEESKAKALSAPDSNMLFRSQKRIIAMYEGILKPDGFRLTGPDVEVLQEAISIEIDAARQRQQQTADQGAKDEITAYQPKQEIIDLINENKGSFRGWLAVAQLEVDGIVTLKGKDTPLIDYSQGQRIFYDAYKAVFLNHGRVLKNVQDSLKKKTANKVKNRGGFRDVPAN